jgi:hypothetical protein
VDRIIALYSRAGFDFLASLPSLVQPTKIEAVSTAHNAKLKISFFAMVFFYVLFEIFSRLGLNHAKLDKN